MRGKIAQYTEEVFKHIAEEYGFWIETMGVEEDHVRIFLEVPPKYSPAQVVQILKSISAREVLEKFPRCPAACCGVLHFSIPSLGRRFEQA